MSSRRIPKTRGAKNGTPKKRQEAGRTAKTGDKPRAAGQKKEQTKQVRVGVSCDYLIFLSRKRKKNKNDVDGKPKKERTSPETQDLTLREFFQTVSVANCPHIKQKPKQNITEKPKTKTNTQKQKFAPENFSKQRP